MDDNEYPAPDFRTSVVGYDVEQIAEKISAGLVESGGVTAIWRSAFRPVLELVAGILGLLMSALTELAAFLAKLLVQSMQTADPAINELAGVTLDEIFGNSGIGGGGSRDPGQAAAAIGKGVIDALIAASASGGGGDGITPSEVPAEKFLGTLMEVGIRGWVLDLIGEVESLGRIHAFNDLVETVIQSLGIGRLTRIALQPAIHLLIAQPMAEKFSLQYRPARLGDDIAARAYLAGAHDSAWLQTELGAKGLSTDRITDIVNAVTKRIPIADFDRLVHDGQLADSDFADELKHDGYQPGDSLFIRRAESLRRIDPILRDELTAQLMLLHEGIIDLDQFQSALHVVQLPADEKEAWFQVAQLRAITKRKALSVAQLGELLTRNILDLSEYRARLEELGYTPDDATLLEMLEQKVISDKADAAQRKAAAAQQKAEAKAKAKADAAAAAQAKKEAAAQAKKDHQAFLEAKQKAADDAALAKTQLTEQAMKDRVALVDQAAKDKLLTAAQVTQQRAQIRSTEQAHAAQVKSAETAQGALAAEADKVSANAVQRQILADKAVAVTAAARKRVQLDQQLLDAKQAARVAGYEAARQSAQDAADAGEITSKQLATKLRAIDLAEKKDVAAEQVRQAEIAKAQGTADQQVAAADFNVASLQEKATTLPAASQRRQDLIATAAADKLQQIALVGSDTMQQLSDITSRRIAAHDAASTAREQLDAELAAQRIALEQQIAANRPKPPA